MDDFTLPPGAPFAKVFDTERGQILVSLEPNDDGNASILIRMYGDEGLSELTLGVAGVRSPTTDAHFVEGFQTITAERALAAFEMAMDPNSQEPAQ